MAGSIANLGVGPFVDALYDTRVCGACDGSSWSHVVPPKKLPKVANTE